MIRDDLKAAAALTDEEVSIRALSDPDAQPLTDEQLSGMVRLADIPGDTLLERLQNLKKRAAKKSLTVRYDADIVDYYKAKGKGYQQAMNDALRVCMEAEKGMSHS